jgi:transcriptional antiterminator RfaH
VTLSTSRWYVVQTQPHSEPKAVWHLGRQGFETYLPRCEKRRRHARRIETIAAPLFPRYLFVAIDMASQRWRSIHSTIGVSHLVCNGDAPTPLASGVVDGLRRREDERGLVRLETRPRFVIGEQVRIVDGIFASRLGLFDGISDNERVAVLLDMLGRKVRVVIDDLSVAAA